MANIRKRGDTFTITASLGYDEQGKQIRKFTTFKPPAGVTAGKAEKLAFEYAVKWEDKIRGYIALDENRTFRELCDWYFDDVAVVAQKENVVYNNRILIETYVTPTIGRDKLKNITPQMLDNLFAALLKNGKKSDYYKLKDTNLIPNGKKSETSREAGVPLKVVQNITLGRHVTRGYAEKIANYLGFKLNDIFTTAVENRGLAPSSVSRIRKSVSAIFTSAVKKEIMRRNPVLHTENIKIEETAESYLNEQQAIHLINALEQQNDFQFKAMITTLLFTGMRAGELCSLFWECVDLEKGAIYIKYTLAYNRGYKTNGRERYRLQKAKTRKSERYVMIPDSLVALLKEQKSQQEEFRTALGDRLVERDSVFNAFDGDYFSPNYLNIKFKTFAAKIGSLPDDVHVHSLRHTTASLLINAGVEAKLVSEQLGHASTAITQDLYSHIFESSKVKSMKVLELALKAAPSPEKDDERL
jgi:integrase